MSRALTLRLVCSHLDSSTTLASLVILCVLGLVGCENEIDDRPNVLPSEPTAGESVAGESAGATAGESAGVTAGESAGAAAGESAPPCESCAEVGAWYRFTTLELESLDGGPHPVVSVLNNLWARDVDDHVLNVLFEVRSVEGDQIKMGAMNAAWVSEADDDYCLMPETAIEFIFTQSQCSISNSDSAGINIYAGSKEITKNCSAEGEATNAIPVRDVLLGADFSTDCSQLLSGSVRSAAIKRSALEGTCSCLSPILESCEGIDPSFEGNSFGECMGCNTRYNSLSRQLNMFQELTWECEVDGEEAVCLEASFAASKLSFTPSVCP